MFDRGISGVVSGARGFLFYAKDGLLDSAREAAGSLRLPSLLFIIESSELLRYPIEVVLGNLRGRGFFVLVYDRTVLWIVLNEGIVVATMLGRNRFLGWRQGFNIRRTSAHQHVLQIKEGRIGRS